jgi:SAM-dependent methyltransferase
MDIDRRWPQLLTKLRRVRYSVASTGWRHGLADLATLWLTYRPEDDHSFDRRFGTDTAGRVPTAKLGIADDAAREQAILYLPSPTRVTRWMLDQVSIDYREFSFVDLGCGKGRVLLVASEYPFRCVRGVEISSALAQIAGANIALYQPPSRRCADVSVETADATRFQFPDTDLLLHLYHPFEPTLTAEVLSRLTCSVQERRRKVIVAYLLYASAVDPVREVFGRFAWLKETRYEQSVLGHYNWLMYSN